MRGVFFLFFKYCTVLCEFFALRPVKGGNVHSGVPRDVVSVLAAHAPHRHPSLSGPPVSGIGRGV